jgi:membrane-associated phospholipid phosphatase
VKRTDVVARPSPLVYLREVVLVFLAYALYYQVRGISADRETEAIRNAFRIIEIERDLGIFEELSIQKAILAHDVLVNLSNVTYFYLLFPLIAPVAIWLLLARPRIYELARDAFFASGAIAVIFFLLLPTAPPRLIDLGFVDTLQGGLVPEYHKLPGVNQFAALPSMHVGWNVLIAYAVFLAVGHGRLRYAVFLLPVAMAASTVTTGNHFFLDAVLGVIVAALGIQIAWMLERARRLQPA